MGANGGGGSGAAGSSPDGGADGASAMAWVAQLAAEDLSVLYMDMLIVARWVCVWGAYFWRGGYMTGRNGDTGGTPLA